MDKAELITTTAKEILLATLQEKPEVVTKKGAGKQTGLPELLDSYKQIFDGVAKSIDSLTAQE
jgi:hypothetical protein